MEGEPAPVGRAPVSPWPGQFYYPIDLAVRNVQGQWVPSFLQGWAHVTVSFDEAEEKEIGRGG